MLQAQPMRAFECFPPIGAGVKWGQQSQTNRKDCVWQLNQALFCWHPWLYKEGLTAKISSL